MAEIQRKIVKQGKRNAVSRYFRATNDKETIAGWRSDLNRILHVFNVRLVVFVWPLLTVRSQTELAMNTHVTVSEIRHDVASTHAIVSDIHRTVVKIQEGADGQTPLVSVTSALFVVEFPLTIIT